MYWMVDVTANIPYPWTCHFPIRASKPHTAAARGVKLFKQKLNREKGIKRINEWSIQMERQKEIQHV